MSKKKVELNTEITGCRRSGKCSLPAGHDGKCIKTGRS